MNSEQFKTISSFLAEKLRGSKFEGVTYIVGGAARDFVMHNDIKDIDVVVAMENGGIELANYFKDNKITDHSIVTYERFGTAMFKLDIDGFNEPIEIECVHTRREVYPDENSRDPEQEYGSIEEDCYRRDLTINALYYDIFTDEVKDFTGKGLSDIENKIIRTTTEDPDKVYTDDPLRILRTVRFAARYNWGIDESTLLSMVRNKERLSIIAKERILNEFQSMMSRGSYAYALDLMIESGIFEYVIPGVIIDDNKIEIVRAIDRQKSKPDFKNTLAAIFIMSGTAEISAREILHSQKYPNDLINDVCNTMSLAKMIDAEPDDTFESKEFVRKCMKTAGSERAMIDAVIVAALIRPAIDDVNFESEYGMAVMESRYAYDFLDALSIEKIRFTYSPTLPITGDDVKERFNRNGKDIKKTLDDAWEIFFKNPKIDKETLLSQLP